MRHGELEPPLRARLVVARPAPSLGAGGRDLGLAQERALLLSPHRSKLRSRVLKVAHHGSGSSSGSAFLAAVEPRLALISVRRGNRFGHPHPDVLRRLNRRRVAVLRTDRDKKVRVIKFKRRKDYMRRQGHRQWFTEVKITAIG